eukprot:CAMPEP_0178469178 /NCGR_PEP_ID=MMETSP0689_2-20121128/53295_1 /TAXON_ID=160604 /ORGANISM="Amphidinium massartii, Strain CS-259" /LENGTH=312 /DNA_ID=CAMNT_0020096245 /DNA_START=37 /DNA_END=975 /DNA_ORIENTATION=-
MARNMMAAFCTAIVAVSTSCAVANLDEGRCASQTQREHAEALLQRGTVAMTSEHVVEQSAESGNNDTGSCVPPGMQVAKLSQGFSMVVLGSNDIVSTTLLSKGSWEISSPGDFAEKVGASSLPTHGTFLDIGANIGYYTMMFAHAGYDVIAVEPMTRNRAAMEGTLCLNPELRSRVKIVPVALVEPDEVGRTKCVIKSTNYEINIGNGALACGHNVQDCAPGDANCEVVPVKTLNMVLGEVHPPAIDMLKMDVENYECHVLAGGDELFTKYSPKFMKIETQWGNTGTCVNQTAAKYGYRPTSMGSDTGLVKI